MKRKIANIQALRGIAVLLVVLYHIMITQRRIGDGGGLLPAWFLVGISGVDLFFTISGFVMVVVTRGKFQRVGEMGRFLYNRLTRVYPMYWTYTLVSLAAFTILGSTALTEDNLFRSLLLIPQNKMPLLSVGWTLIHEVYFYLAFTLLLWAPERQLSKILAGWALLILGVHGALAVTGAGMPSPVLRIAIHPLTLEFIMGALVARSIHNRALRGGIWVFSGGAALLVAGGAVFYAFRPDVLWGDWARVVCLGLPSAVLLAGAVTMETKTGGALPRVLGVVGDASYSMYLSHFLLIQAIARICGPMIGRAGCNDLVFALIMFVGVVIYGIASYRILERPVMMLLRRK